MAFLSAASLGACASGGVAGLRVTTREMKFTPSTMSIAAGDRTITVHNSGTLTHTFSINDLGQEVTVSPGATKSLTISLKPGKYAYVCRILDHEGLGMHGVLTVSKS